MKIKQYIMKIRQGILLIAISISSVCSVFSQKEAKDFVIKQYDSLTQDVVYLVLTDSILYSNEAISQMTYFNELDSVAKEDIEARYLLIGNLIDYSVALNEFKNELVRSLEAVGFRVVVTKAENLPDVLSPYEHSLNVAQLELEEYATIDSIQNNSSSKPYVYRKTLNGIRFNAWFLYNEKDTSSSLTLFCNEETADYFAGEITLKQGKPSVTYNITKINPNDAYRVSFFTGRTSAIYFFNLLLNKYVFLKTDGRDTNYYGIDFNSGNLLMDGAPFDNFDVIESL
ncbi:MAG: hypothetical protein LBO06_06265 [Bacteroidales bacterium]|jgi:hypothetical protein|nr:hypothetical protein [Bacteroidales bacterium]